MSCRDCPELVLGILRHDAEDALRRMREVKQLVYIINRVVIDVGIGLEAELFKLVTLIPDPPLFDLRLLSQLITCPLTPQAFATDLFDQGLAAAEQNTASIPLPAKIGAQVAEMASFNYLQAAKMGTMATGVKGVLLTVSSQIDYVIQSIRNTIDQFIESSNFQWLLRILWRYVQEVERVLGGTAGFIMRMAVTTTNAAMVRTLCPELYESNRLPYKAFIAESKDFSFDGFNPTSLSVQAARLLVPITRLQYKISSWQSARFLLI